MRKDGDRDTGNLFHKKKESFPLKGVLQENQWAPAMFFGIYKR